MKMKMLKTLTVAELIEILEECRQDAPVVFASDYGDHSHTEQALPIKGEVEQTMIQPSAYSDSGWAIATDDTEDEDEVESERVVIVIR